MDPINSVFDAKITRIHGHVERLVNGARPLMEKMAADEVNLTARERAQVQFTIRLVSGTADDMIEALRDAVRDELSTLEKEKQALERERRNFEDSKLSEVATSTKRIEEELRRISTSVKDVLDNTKTKFYDLESAVKTNIGATDTANNVLRELQSSGKEAKAVLDSNESLVRETKLITEGIGKTVERAGSSLTSLITGLEERVGKTVDKTESSLATLLTKLAKSVEGVQGALNSVQASLDADTSFEVLLTDLASLGVDIKTVKTAVGPLPESVKTDLGGLAKLIEEVRAASVAHRAAFDKVAAEIQSDVRRIGSVNENVTGLRSELSTNMKIASKQLTAIRTTSASVSSVQALTQRIEKAENIRYRSELDRIAGERDTALGNLTLAKAELVEARDSHRSAIEKIASERDKAVADLGSTKVSLVDSTAELESARVACKKADALVSQGSEELEALKDEMERTEAELQTARDQLAAAMGELEKAHQISPGTSRKRLRLSQDESFALSDPEDWDATAARIHDAVDEISVLPNGADFDQIASRLVDVAMNTDAYLNWQEFLESSHVETWYCYHLVARDGHTGAECSRNVCICDHLDAEANGRCFSVRRKTAPTGIAIEVDWRELDII